MRRMLMTGLVAALAGTLLAAPVPKDNRKPAAFPAGRYVLAGAGEAATGDDVFEMVKTFRLRPGQYILSGGQKPTDVLLVDDDLDLLQGETKLFVDNDQVRTTEDRGKRAARYQGQPIVLVLDSAKKLRVRATDWGATEAIIGELWLHRWDGARKKLTDGKVEASSQVLPATFFDESFALADGFELPKNVSTDAATDMPEKPARLLPRFQNSPTPAPATQPQKPVNAGEFIREAIKAGLAADGVPTELAAALAKRDDFLGKCSLCGPTRDALIAHGKLKHPPAAQEGRGLSAEFTKKIQSDDDATRRAGLREVVQRYKTAAFDGSKLDADEKAALQKELEEMRKLSMGGLPTGQKFCPSCDGACRLAPKS